MQVHISYTHTYTVVSSNLALAFHPECGVMNTRWCNLYLMTTLYTNEQNELLYFSFIDKIIHRTTL